MKNILSYEHSEDIETYEDDENGDQVLYTYRQTEKFGFVVFDVKPEIATIENKELYLNNVIVEDYSFYTELENEVPCHYVVRKFNGQYMGFICGLDILESGESWDSLTDIKRDTFIETWDNLVKVHGDIKLFLEEPMEFM
jgi:hypothetical protein